MDAGTNTQTAKKAPIVRYFSYLLGWLFFVSLFIAAFWPQLLGFDRSPAYFTLVLTFPFLILFFALSTAGFRSVIKWVFGFIYYPIRSSLYAFSKVRATYKWYRKPTSKIFLTISIFVVCITGFYADSASPLTAIAILARVCLIIIVFRISEKAFDPFGSVGRTINGFTELKENPFFKMFVNFFKNQKGPQTDAVKSLDNALKTQAYILKVPEFVQNPKLPLLLFASNGTKVVTFIRNRAAIYQPRKFGFGATGQT